MKHSNNLFIGRLLRGAALALVAASSTALLGDDGGSKFGGYASFALPTGDMGKTFGTGFGLGGFWEYSFTKQASGQASAQYMLFGEKEVEFGLSSSGNTLSLNYDLHWKFTEGFYGLVGVGYHNCTIKVEAKEAGFSDSESEGKIGLSIGAGYYFSKNIGVEAKYFQAGFGTPEDGNGANWT